MNAFIWNVKRLDIELFIILLAWNTIIQRHNLYCSNSPWIHAVVLLYFITIMNNFSNFEESTWIVTLQNVEFCVILFIVYKLTRDRKWWQDYTALLSCWNGYFNHKDRENIRWTEGHVGLWKDLSPSAKSKASNISHSCLVGKLWQNYS